MTIRPYLPTGRATVRAVPRTGRPPAALSAALRSRAIAIVADRAARGEPPIDGEALAAELGCAPSAGRRILAELRAADLAPAAVPSATGRQMARPPAPGKVVRIRAATLAALAAATGRPVGEDVDGQVCDLLSLYNPQAPARGEE